GPRCLAAEGQHVPPGPVDPLVRREELRVLGRGERIVEVAEHLLVAQVEHTPRGRSQEVVPAVPADAETDTVGRVVPGISPDLRRRVDRQVLYRDPPGPPGPRRPPRPVELPPAADPAAH